MSDPRLRILDLENEVVRLFQVNADSSRRKDGLIDDLIMQLEEYDPAPDPVVATLIERAKKEIGSRY